MKSVKQVHFIRNIRNNITYIHLTRLVDLFVSLSILLYFLVFFVPTTLKKEFDNNNQA